MSDQIADVLAEETEASELGRDAEPTSATKASRPNRNKSKVYSVRLSESEMAALQDAADFADLAPSTLARQFIVLGLRELPWNDHLGTPAGAA